MYSPTGGQNRFACNPNTFGQDGTLQSFYPTHTRSKFSLVSESFFQATWCNVIIEASLRTRGGIIGKKVKRVIRVHTLTCL